jgi:hypothetical protein
MVYDPYYGKGKKVWQTRKAYLVDFEQFVNQIKRNNSKLTITEIERIWHKQNFNWNEKAYQQWMQAIKSHRKKRASLNKRRHAKQKLTRKRLPRKS